MKRGARKTPPWGRFSLKWDISNCLSETLILSVLIVAFQVCHNHSSLEIITLNNSFQATVHKTREETQSQD